MINYSILSFLLSSIGKPLKTAIVCFILIAVFAIALIAVSLYGFVYAAISHSTSGTTLAEQGDYVLLDYRISKYGFAIFDYVLQFTVLPSVDSVQLISIYDVPCSSLLDKTKRISIFTNPNSISSNQKYYFSNCSNGICVLDQFVYQAISSESRIVYNITLSSFMPNKTKILIVAYDNLQYFHEFLNGTVLSKSIKHFYANDIDFTFNISTRDMKHSSYYFFAIKSVTGSSGWFTVERSGLHVYYNASNLSPKCVINNGCNCSCEVKISNNKQCFLGHMQHRTNENNSSKQIYTIHHEATEPKVGYLIIPGICILFALIIIITIFAIGRSLFFRKKRQIATGPLSRQSIIHTQTTLVSDALTVNFQDPHSCPKAALDNDAPLVSTEEQASPHGTLTCI